jgi:MFS family permease
MGVAFDARRIAAVPDRAEGHYPVAIATIALLMAGVVLPSPLYNLYRIEFRLTPGEVGLVFAVYALSLIPSLVFLGGISDAIGRRRTMLMGVSLLGLGSLIFAFADGLIWLLIARVLQGFAIGMSLSASIAAVHEWMSESQRKRAGQLIVVATSAGAILGALLGGVLGQYARHGSMLAFLIHIALLALVSIGIVLTPSYPHVHPSRSQLLFVPKEIRRPFFLAASQAFIGWATLGVFMSLVPSFLDATLGLRSLMVGALVIVVMQAASVPVSLFGNRLDYRAAIITGLLVLGAGVWSLLVSVPLKSVVLIAVAAIFVGAGFGWSYLVALRIVEDIATPDDRADVTAALLLACYGGFTLPALAIGYVADGMGFYRSMFAAAVLLGVIAVTIIAFARDRYLKVVDAAA